MSLTCGLCELTLESRDYRALARFYADVLALKTLSEEEDRVWLACGPRSRLGLWSIGEKEFGDRGGRHAHFALSVGRSQLRAVERRLRERGIDCRGPVEHDGGDASLYMRAPLAVARHPHAGRA